MECIEGSGLSYCGCFGESESYSFTRGTGDWTRTNFVSVQVEALARGVPFLSSPAEFTLTNSATSRTVNANSQCSPDVRVTRVYSVFGGGTCRYMERVTGRTAITIPAPTIVGSGCIAPTL